MKYATKTTNKSFIDMWRYLQRMNVENNIFMLELQNPALSDFSINKYLNMDRDDPSFDEYREMVVEEARQNIWFLFRELFVMPDPDNPNNFIPFQLTPGAMAMIFLHNRGYSFINTDIENELCLYYLWYLHLSCGVDNAVIADDTDHVINVHYSVKKCMRHMPIPISFGSADALGDPLNRYIKFDKDTLYDFSSNTGKTFSDYIIQYYQNNLCVREFSLKPYFYILDRYTGPLTRTYLIDVLDKYKSSIYINSIINSNSTDSIIFNTLIRKNHKITEKFEPKMYDIFGHVDPDNKTLYLI